MKKVLIANRGEIAVRIIRACQELGLKTVAVHSVADKSALHTKLADESICIGPAQSLKSYLHIPTVMSAAELAGVDAIHPGYGFLSENAEFAGICEQYGITFIGPTAKQMLSLGNKVEARRLAISAKVPLLPGSDGVLKDAKKALSLAKDIGFPVIIKAAAGGGGRGMKIAHSEEEFIRLFPLAQREAEVGFNNPDVYVEKFLSHPRHVEVQIIADKHGNVAALGERDCSIQRRHQKLVEEAPCPVLSPQKRKEVADIAIRLAKAEGYQSLGTVEFLYADGNFYFMEMNTRAQVEHPVTEMVTGIDLIKEQILIAQGKKLDLKAQSHIGHSIECRINAEDPKSFAPWPGLVKDFHQPGGPGVRVDTMLYSGYTVPSMYDSLIAKLIIYGKDREECLIRMERALKEMQITGIRTNIPFHLKLLEDKDFRSGNVSTRFLDTFKMT